MVQHISLPSTVLDYVSPSAALIAQRPSRAATTVVWAVSALFASSIGVASIFSVDRVVQARGHITIPETTITVQPLETAIVRSVDVQLNEVVRAGQVIAHLDPTFASADVGVLENRAAALQPEIQRLEAELQEHLFEAGQGSNSVLQATIYSQRRAEYIARIESYGRKLDVQQTAMDRAADAARRLRERLGVATQVEGMRRELEQGQIGSKLSLLSAIDGRLEVSRSLAAAEAEERSAAREIEALRAESAAFAAQWHAQVSQQLAERRSTMSEVQENLSKARLRNRLVELTASADSVVLEFGKVAAGAVLQPGETIMTLAPLSSQFEVESEIEARDVGLVGVGNRVQVKLDAFPYMRHGTIAGQIRALSAGAFSRGNDGQQRPTFYRAKISLDDLTSLRNLPPNFHLRPGGPVMADIVVGRHTIVGYFFEKLLEPVHEGFREP